MQDILLLHGAVGSKEQLVPLSEKLKHNFNVHLINFSGHGGTSLPGKPFSIPLFAEDVYNYIVQNKLQQVNIFGYSISILYLNQRMLFKMISSLQVHQRLSQNILLHLF